MNRYIITPFEDKEGSIERYLIENDISISKDNILSYSDFDKIRDFPSFIFFIKYDFFKDYKSVAEQNRKSGGINVSLAGSSSPFIDISLDSVKPSDIKRILSYEKRNSKEKGGKLLCVASISGGVGKSGFALNFSQFISKKLNKRVLLIDMSLSNRSLSQSFEETSFGGSTLDEVIENYYNYGIFSSSEVDKLIMKKPYFENCATSFDFLSCCLRYCNAQRLASSPFWLKSLFKHLRSRYDFILLDTTASVSLLNEYLLKLSDENYFLLKLSDSLICKRLVDNLGTLNKSTSVFIDKENDFAKEIFKDKRVIFVNLLEQLSEEYLMNDDSQEFLFNELIKE